MYGKEMVVKLAGTVVGIYRTTGVLEFKWVGVFTTTTDCSALFDWSGSRNDWPSCIYLRYDA